MWQTGRSARFDGFEQISGPTGDIARRAGVRSSVASPIVVEGRRWGAMVVLSRTEPLPPGTEGRMADFTELVAVAVANAEARAQLRRIAEEQSALRRVATLVAQAGSPSLVFEAVTREVGLPDPGRRAPVGGDRGLDQARGVVPPDTEAQIAAFTELVSTAVENAESRAELAASRARVVAAADKTRRRLERDLHDGAQQRLVSLALRLRAAAATVPPDLGEVHQELAGVGDELDELLGDLRELSRGIHPAILSQGGLGPALRTLARRSSVPVQLQVGLEGRLPERVEVAAYYVVSEALTNAAKHANASAVQVDVDRDDGLVRLAIRDDAVGGADPGRGSGLIGLKDRVEGTGGTLRVESRPGEGTSLLVELPVDSGRSPDAG